MRKFIVFLFSFTIHLVALSQNVGIGTPTPTEKLDVNGNVNIQGNLKVNGISGQPNQVLMTNNSGATVWADYCEFKNFFCVQTAGPSTWTVPAGVTRIMIESWGAGGGGAAGGGGGSGAYVRDIKQVTPGQVININIGYGGLGALNEASNGGTGQSTTIDGDLPVPGGFGATPSNPGQGGFNLVTAKYLIYGNNGMPTTETYAQRNSTEWATIRKYGDGAKAVLINGNEGTGCFFTFNTNSLLNISIIRSLSGKGAGAGGGGGPDNLSRWGSNGADGVVIIHY